MYLCTPIVNYIKNPGNTISGIFLYDGQKVILLIAYCLLLIAYCLLLIAYCLKLLSVSMYLSFRLHKME